LVVSALRRVVLDFGGVDLVGQGFADGVSVWARAAFESL
jgi:hypothetical protein